MNSTMVTGIKILHYVNKTLSLGAAVKQLCSFWRDGLWELLSKGFEFRAAHQSRIETDKAKTAGNTRRNPEIQ